MAFGEDKWPLLHAPNGVFLPHRRNRRDRINGLVLECLRQLIDHPQRCVDIGCGYGGPYVKSVQFFGSDVVGVDGYIAPDNHSLLKADLTLPIDWPLILPWGGGLANWSICNDVAEHIPEPLCDAFLKNLTTAATDYMLLIWGTVRQRHKGIGHVNCLEPYDAETLLFSYGWKRHNDLTSAARSICRADRFLREKIFILEPRYDAFLRSPIPYRARVAVAFDGRTPVSEGSAGAEPASAGARSRDARAALRAETRIRKRFSRRERIHAQRRLRVRLVDEVGDAAAQAGGDAGAAAESADGKPDTPDSRGTEHHPGL